MQRFPGLQLDRSCLCLWQGDEVSCSGDYSRSPLLTMRPCRRVYGSDGGVISSRTIISLFFRAFLL